MSRQRLRPSLEETSGIVCPRCQGQGTVRDVKSLALSILRLVEEEALKEKTSEIRAQVPVPVGTFLLNEKRHVISRTEKNHDVRILIIPNPNLETPQYEVQRLRSDHTSATLHEDSFDIQQESEELLREASHKENEYIRPEAAVRHVKPSQPAPQIQKNPGLKGLIKSLVNLFSAEDGSTNQPERKQTVKTRSSTQRSRSQSERKGGARSQRNSRTGVDQNQQTRENRPASHRDKGQQRRKREQREPEPEPEERRRHLHQENSRTSTKPCSGTS